MNPKKSERANRKGREEKKSYSIQISSWHGSFRHGHTISNITSNSKRIEPIHTHSVDVAVPGQIETDDNNEICKHEDRAFEIIALSLSIHIRQEEDAENDGYHIPLREYETVLEGRNVSK